MYIAKSEWVLVNLRDKNDVILKRWIWLLRAAAPVILQSVLGNVIMFPLCLHSSCLQKRARAKLDFKSEQRYLCASLKPWRAQAKNRPSPNTSYD